VSADPPEEFVANVPQALAGVRVDRAVSILTGVSRSEAADLVASGRVRVDGRAVVQRSSPLAAGSELSVVLPDETAPVAPVADVPFDVVYEDAALVVVDKPPGVVVHPGAGTRTPTLIAGLLARYPDIGALASTTDPARPGVVHRIDKGTSGLLVVARTPAAYRALVSQMGARTVGRRYLALVEGLMADDRGVVDAPVGRSTRTPTKMAVTPAGRPARTRYLVVDRVDGLRGGRGWVPRPSTLLSCALETGRTHQIRVHFAAIGHPVVGDDRYGPGATRHVLAPGRLFLHAAELAIDHPESGARMTWTSPLPPDLLGVLPAGTPAG
jgi:23S rRNA pseudouridine1911/1915/1917 synthase